MNKDVQLDLLPKESDRVMKELSDKNMVIARSKNDFLYMLDFNDEFLLFSHTPGAPDGGQKQLPKDEKHRAVIKKIVDLADSLYLAQYDRRLNVYGVMSAVEEGILSLFPGSDRDSDAAVEFEIRGGTLNDDDEKQ
ncbi:MAG: hypothetical protein GX111_06650 [Clostridiales bacterium]|jgi:hypothetical protein|nr:hypothetical protein [Clostridiales bacterium]